MSTEKEPDPFQVASDIISSKNSPPYEVIMPLAQAMAREYRFDYARLLIANYRRRPPPEGVEKPLDRDDRRKLIQKHSLYTYKDPDLPGPDRLDRALAILAELGPLEETTDPETLGQAGAIHKRKWELDGQRLHLERSLGYYERAYAGGIRADDGWTAVNTAFVHDLLADQERAEGRPASPQAEQHREKADKIRDKVITTLSSEEPRYIAANEAAPDDKKKDLKWLYASLAEALFGRERYGEAGVALEKFVASSPDPWEKDSAARQLGRLFFLRSRGGEPTPAARQALAPLLGDNPDAIQSTFVGKVGLALSGGGFRASLFHLGVLAYLAEMHLLRYVEVLSCVSGGSIVGAHYYLALQKALESRADGAMTQADYVKLVDDVAEQFLRGVQKNLRMRLLGNPWKTLMIAIGRGYSHTDRAGELFERHLYRDAGKEPRTERYMNELEVRPFGTPLPFNPRRDNWRRADKVPVLVLNATAMNTGHNWQFAATWMGEPPGDLGRGVDANDWLRRLPYASAPDAHKKVRLGFAVAASACVPGLFRPLEIKHLYKGGWNVRLADGGVHDNQGVATLLEQECTILLVSDASGQSPSQKHPGTDVLTVSLRANDILMGRVRQEQHRRLAALQAAGRIRGLMFIHLRKGLVPQPVNWEGCDEDARHFLDYETNGTAAHAGDRQVPDDIQRQLAGIRTDLDTFNDVEAYSLMTSGYLQAQADLPQALRRFAAPQVPGKKWFFLRVEDLYSSAGEASGRSEKLKSLLSAAEYRAFKVFRLSGPLRALVAALALGAAAGLWITRRQWSTWSVDIPGTVLAGAVLAAVVIAVVGRVAEGRLKNFATSIPRRTLWLGLALVGPLLVWPALWTLDRLYLHKGRMGLPGPHHGRRKKA